MKLHEIRIGTLVNGAESTRIIPQILPYGFESFSLTFWRTVGDVDLKETARKLKEVLAGKDAVISALTIFGNPLIDDQALKSWERLIDSANFFDTDLVTGFTGRLVNRPIDDSIPRFKEIFSELAKRAKDENVRLAFENCDMEGNWRTGDWNIAHNPIAWEMMFNALPLDNLGLEWEPCHQMVNLIDPIPQLRKWAHKIFHVHGKDATVAWDIIREHGIDGPKQFAWHRTPGFGDSNWTDIITILRQAGYKGAIDIEGYHDPVYRDSLEMTGQVRALNYLKQCCGGDYFLNPV